MTNFRTEGYTAQPKNPQYTVGKCQYVVNAAETITAAENADGDTWELAGPLPIDARVARVIGKHPAFTSATDNDLGFYKKDKDGNLVEIDKDILWDGVSLATAVTTREDLLTTKNSSLDITKSIGELLSLTSEDEPQSGIFLVLTMNTASSATSEKFDWDIMIEPATRGV